MPRKFFDQKLQSLNQDLTEVGNLVSSRIGDTIEALRGMDVKLAAQVVAGDVEVDRASTALNRNVSSCWHCSSRLPPTCGLLPPA